mmetsp:Transcript_20445/g.58388  ORF Transcript_20445/g.58388 Transcript_20445/m.58388 type:complete len:237 (+) Transcript_20445:399-1109(+)
MYASTGDAKGDASSGVSVNVCFHRSAFLVVARARGLLLPNGDLFARSGGPSARPRRLACRPDRPHQQARRCARRCSYWNFKASSTSPLRPRGAHPGHKQHQGPCRGHRQEGRCSTFRAGTGRFTKNGRECRAGGDNPDRVRYGHQASVALGRNPGSGRPGFQTVNGDAAGDSRGDWSAAARSAGAARSAAPTAATPVILHPAGGVNKVETGERWRRPAVRGAAVHVGSMVAQACGR